MQNIPIDERDVLGCYPEVTAEARIGNGTFKQVFKVTDSTGATFVVKCVQIDVREGTGVVRVSVIEDRLKLEMGLIESSVTSPYIPSSGPIEARTFQKSGLTFQAFTEEFVGEKTVDRLINENYFTAEKLKKLLHDVVSALEVYNDYEQGFVHRDVKPGNIILNETTDSFVLIDPGVHLKPSNPTLTVQNVAPQGTPAYYSPEQAQGARRQLDVRSDFFALGIIAYQIINGSHPFNPSVADPAWMTRLITSQYVPLDPNQKLEYSSLMPLTHKLLGRYPHTRFNNTQALLLELGGV